MDSPSNIITGIYKNIVVSSALITDYIEVGGIGATFVNSGLLTLISIIMLYLLKININGVSIAGIFLLQGFGLFGKNIFNVWLIILGVFLYAKVQKENFSKYIYVAFFGTCMGPAITQILFNIDQPLHVRILLSVCIGTFMGFILPPLASFFVRIHQGFNLYNVGFTGGMIASIVVAVLRSYNIEIESNFQWSTGNNFLFSILLFGMFSSMILIGYWLNGCTFKNLKNIFKYGGKLVTDFVSLEGFGVTLINMGINGMMGLVYILLFRGDLNGPTIGGILTMVAFGGFGKHARNMPPIFIGIILGGLTKAWSLNDPSIQLAALFSTALAPIAGEFGWKYGVLAGFINSSVVLNVGVLHGGLNLYNTGFASGFAAVFLVPIIEAFRKGDS